MAAAKLANLDHGGDRRSDQTANLQEATRRNIQRLSACRCRPRQWPCLRQWWCRRTETLWRCQQERHQKSRRQGNPVSGCPMGRLPIPCRWLDGRNMLRRDGHRVIGRRRERWQGHPSVTSIGGTAKAHANLRDTEVRANDIMPGFVKSDRGTGASASSCLKHVVILRPSARAEWHGSKLAPRQNRASPLSSSHRCAGVVPLP